jgi:hypothetical protein
MAMIPTATDHVSFWAGCPDGMTPWEYGNTGKDYTADTPFYVTSKGLLHCSNLDATGGTIGSFKIDEVNPNNTGHIGIYSKQGSYCNGFVSYSSGGGNVAFWAGATIPNVDTNGDIIGYNPATPWEILSKTDEWEDYVPFYVENSGKVACKNLKAMGGQIGGLDIYEQGIKGIDFNLTKNGLLFHGETSKIVVNTFEIKNVGNSSLINANGELVIQGHDGEGGRMIFNQTDDTTQRAQLYIEF